MPALKFALVGVGGFGHAHLNSIRYFTQAGEVQLAAVCDKYLDRYPDLLEELHAKGIRCYEDYERFLASGEELDLLILSTPIPLHKRMSIRALEAGYNVLLEKPPAVTIQDLDEMIAAHRRHPQLCAVNFQHTAEPSFVRLLDEVRQGRLGSIRSVSAQGIWSRDSRYFARTPWAGRLLLNGDYVLDGTVNNPFAHLLNNCLFVAEAQGAGGGGPVRVQGELYRANAIEGEDTSSIRILTRNGAEVFFTVTVCAAANEVDAPSLRVEGSEADATWDYDGNLAFYAKGSDAPTECRRIGPRTGDSLCDSYARLIGYLSGREESVGCTLEQTRNFLLASNLAFESSGTTHPVPAEFTRIEQDDGATTVCINGICDAVRRAYAHKRLLSECGVGWGVPTRPVEAEGYRIFEMFR